MPVALGASLSDPQFVFVQILYTMSIFFLILGFAHLTIELLALLCFDAPGVPLSTALGTCFHIPLQSLFTVKVINPTGTTSGTFPRFFLMHIIAAFGMSYPLSLTIQRRKFALDFVFTLYVIYFFFSMIASGRLLGGGLAWWLTVCSGFAILYATTALLSRRRELQDIFFSNPAVGAVGVEGGGDVGGDGSAATLMGGVAPDLHERDAVSDGWSFATGNQSPSHATEAVVMGPGCASKRRR